MTELQRQQHAARMRTLETVRVVIEGGSVRFVPAVYGPRELKPARHYLWDRIGKR